MGYRVFFTDLSYFICEILYCFKLISMFPVYIRGPLALPFKCHYANVGMKCDRTYSARAITINIGSVAGWPGERAQFYSCLNISIMGMGVMGRTVSRFAASHKVKFCQAQSSCIRGSNPLEGPI